MMKSHPKTDLKTEEDIQKIVDLFYEKTKKDELLSPYFEQINWESHLPLMYSFWSSLMFGAGKYFGYPDVKHEKMKGLKNLHFNRWVELFTATIDELYKGDQAVLMKEKAEQIAGVFAIKLGIPR